MSNKHFEMLEIEYNKIGNLTWENDDFLDCWLHSSRCLFDLYDYNSISPKDLEVYALVSGIQFSLALQVIVKKIQIDLDLIIGPIQKYWVKPENLGVEYCVFKWPEELWDSKHEEQIINLLNVARFIPFTLHLNGIQVNRDGCIVLKGFDCHESVFKLRQFMRDNLSFIPQKQSNWAHIPIGRILEPIGLKAFSGLEKYVQLFKNKNIHNELIKDVKFVHETKWYMENRSIIKTLN